MKILSFINILCVSNKAINMAALKGLFSSSISSPCFSLVTWACNISTTLQRRATSVCTRLKFALLIQHQKKTCGPGINGLPTDLAAEVGQPADQDRMVFSNTLQKLRTLEGSRHSSKNDPLIPLLHDLQLSNTSVFRPKRGITLSQALHLIHLPCTETRLLQLCTACSLIKRQIALDTVLTVGCFSHPHKNKIPLDFSMFQQQSALESIQLKNLSNVIFLPQEENKQVVKIPTPSLFFFFFFLKRK